MLPGKSSWYASTKSIVALSSTIIWASADKLPPGNACTFAKLIYELTVSLAMLVTVYNGSVTLSSSLVPSM